MLAIEAVPEREDLKRAVVQLLDAALGEDAVVAPVGKQLALDADATKCFPSPFTTPSDCSPVRLDGPKRKSTNPREDSR